MAKSGTLGQLNPDSVPFFPASRVGEDEGRGSAFGYHHSAVELDRRSASSVSISPSDYRSSKSSPSPPTDDRISDPLPSRRQLSSTVDDEPPFRHFDANRTLHVVENRISREPSMLGNLESLPEGDDIQDTPGPFDQQQNVSFYPHQQGRDRLHSSTPPVSINHSGSSHHTGPFSSSSPVSSLDSGSQFTPNHDLQTLNFESQLKASPLIHEILDRLVRCEYSTREIQRDLGDVQRKVNLLVERSLGSSSQPEFKDPFANPGVPSFSGGPRPSLGNIAPNQAAPSDDITTISQRLNTLTSSVGQLLALQTQQIQSSSGHNGGLPISGLPVDMTPPHMMPNQSLLGHGLPNRPDLRSGPRVPNPPMRTWSAGTLDLPLRQPDSIPRQDNIPRDKRRSVSGLIRRDSSSVLDVQNGDGRDGPLISKWEQLQLAPDLLRSLSKFGVGPPNKIQQRALPFLLRGSDIIAQAPPTQERIAAYVIPAIQIALMHTSNRSPTHGPIVIMISTTVDQATQAQRMIRDLGGPIGIRSALGVGATSASGDLSQELRLLQQNIPHIICGTPQKLHALFTAQGGLNGSEVRFLVLDEVDQLIARNLHEFVFNIVKLLPPPRSRPPGNNSSATPSSATGPFSPSSLDSSGMNSPFPAASRRFSTTPNPDNSNSNPTSIERQTALFSNTVPQDVLNLATSIQLREPVRVLVRRDGNVTQADTLQGARGLRQYYLYLAFTAGSRMEPAPGGGLGIIGSGRGASNAETAQAREWKLDALADLLDDADVSQAIVHAGGMTALDAVVYKLASRGIEAIPLHGDMAAPTKLAALNKYRSPASSVVLRQPAMKVLVVYDVQIKDITQVPLIINYDLPKAVEEYAHRVAPAIAPNNYSRPGVVVNFVTATGGDVEMLRSIECFYKIKCPEVPMSLRDIV